MNYFITGAAGFIGSQLVDRLLANGETVIGYDNLTTGKIRFLESAMANPSFRFVKGDLLESEALTRAMKGAEFVFHLAANADVRFGIQHPERDLQQTREGFQNSDPHLGMPRFPWPRPGEPWFGNTHVREHQQAVGVDSVCGTWAGRLPKISDVDA